MAPYNTYGAFPSQRRHPQVRGKNVPIPDFAPQGPGVAGGGGVQPGVERLLDFRRQSAGGPGTQNPASASFNLPQLGPVPMKPGQGGALTGAAAGNPGQYTPGMRLAEQIGRSMGINQIGGFRPHGSVKNSDHPKHRAWDFMTGHNKALGYSLIQRLQPQWSQLGIKYIIFDNKINKGNGWQPYSHPHGNNPTLRHEDHVHVSFY